MRHSPQPPTCPPVRFADSRRAVLRLVFSASVSYFSEEFLFSKSAPNSNALPVRYKPMERSGLAFSGICRLRSDLFSVRLFMKSLQPEHILRDAIQWRVSAEYPLDTIRRITATRLTCRHTQALPADPSGRALLAEPSVSSLYQKHFSLPPLDRRSSLSSINNAPARRDMLLSARMYG